MSGNRNWKLTLFSFLVVLTLAGGAAQPATAARLGDIPVMVELTAGLRATAALDPDEKIRNPDAMARQFLSPSFWFWSALNEDYDKCKTFIKFYRVGAYYTANAFTKHIDGILTTAAASGFEQMVILGAGLDSRAQRIPGMENASVYEIDSPAIQLWKRQRLRVLLGHPAPNVTLVPIDFKHEELSKAMAHTDFDRDADTFFIWEGVSQYMLPRAVDATFHYVVNATRGESRLVFTYID